MATPGPAPSTTLDDTLAVFDGLDDPGTPLTASEVADALECSRRTAYNKLQTLADRSELHTKKTGARGRIWWRPLAARPSDQARRHRFSRTEFESFVDAVIDYAIFTLDPDGRVASWNEGARRIKGYEEADILGRHLSTFYTETDIDRGVPATNLQTAREAGRVEDEGWRVRRDGSWFWASVVITAIHDDDGELLGFTKVTRDMTERREREEALRQERDLLDEVLETSPVGMAIIDDRGDLLRANSAAKRLMGMDGEDVEGHSLGRETLLDEIGEPLPPADRPAGRALRTGEPVVAEHVQLERENDERRWVVVNATPITDADGEVERVVLASEDITQLKEQARRLERQRDELEAELDEVFDRVTDAFYALDEDWRFTHLNERAEEIIQRSAAAVVGERIWDEFPETADGIVWDEFHRAMDTQEAVSFDLFYDPLEVWVEVRAYPSTSGLSVYFRDITDRKEYERELQEQRERYRGLLEAAPVAIAIFDEGRRLQYVNDAGANLVGADCPANLIGTQAVEFVHPEDEATAVAGLQRAIEDREPTPSTELRLVGLDGEDEVRHTMANSVPITYEGSPASQTVLADITAQKRRERQLARQREQLSALNQLNGVVQEITHAVIESSNREEIEKLVCHRLAATASYEYAWIGAIDRQRGRVTARTIAGLPDADDLSVPIEDDPMLQGPTGNAARTGEIHYAQRLDEGAGEPPGRQAIPDGIRSVGAIPIEFEDAVYGVLTIGSTRPTAFNPDEADVVSRLGQVVGHAITAVERKRALVSDEVVELRFRVRDYLDDLAVAEPSDGTITFDRMVSVGEVDYLVYGTVSGDATETLDSMVDARPHYRSVKYLRDGPDGGRFELSMVEPPGITAVAAYGGRVDEARIGPGGFDLVVHVPPGTDIRALVEDVNRCYPDTEVLAQRRRDRSGPSALQREALRRQDLTDRQRSVLEAAYVAGYFEWPRGRTGEQIADSLDISASTFHQHVRVGERKLMGALFGKAA